MSGPRDDFLDALNYQVKEEVVKNYLRERLILEEEIAEYRQTMREYRQLEDQARRSRDDLACLLVSPENFREFFRLLGFDQPPLARLGRRDPDQGPTCPIGLTPRGFTKKGKYVGLTLETYRRFFDAAAQGRKAAEGLFALASEVNEDIKKFHLNHDLMSIIHFLKSMDIGLRLKQKYMGDNFSAAEIGSIEHKMMFSRLKPRLEGVRAWPELPSLETVRKKTSAFLGDLFRQEREALLPVLGRN